jgi:hypothetical protein
MKVAVGVLFATFIEFKIKNKMSRQIDDPNKGTTCRQGILVDMIALAKAYEAEENTGDDIELLACDFGQVYMLTVTDFAGVNIEQVTSWTGPRPQKPPRIE